MMNNNRYGGGSGGGQQPSSTSPSTKNPNISTTTIKKQYFQKNNEEQAAGSLSSTSGNNRGADKKSFDNIRSGVVDFYPSSKIKLLHQRTSLSLAFDRTKGWGYQGETALYVIVDNSVDTTSKSGTDAAAADDDKSSNNDTDGAKGDEESKGVDNVKDGAAKSHVATRTDEAPTTPLGGIDINNGQTKPITLALHLRDGCFVESVNVFGPATTVTNNSSAKTNKNDDSMEIDTDGPTTQSSYSTMTTKLHPIPHHTVSFAHHDPLSVVLTRPPSLHSVEDDGVPHFAMKDGVDGDDVVEAKMQSSVAASAAAAAKTTTTRRYEADAHATRGTKGMLNSIRAASIASAMGELRLTIAPLRGEVVDSANNDELQPPQSKLDVMQCWKNDLLQSKFNEEEEEINGSNGTGESTRGSIQETMTNNMLQWRCTQRRDARIDLISNSLAGASIVEQGGEKAAAAAAVSAKGCDGKKEKWPLSPAMKIVVRFSLRPLGVPPTSVVPTVNDDSVTLKKSKLANVTGHHYIGGLSFTAPSNDESQFTTPHVYTIAGSHGDHQGIRSWLPTLDSASPNHRCSHELVIRVTSRRKEGLWPSASGEDFGLNESVSHPILGNDASEAVFGPMKRECSDNDALYQKGVEEAERVWNYVDGSITKALGARHFKFINDFFYGLDDDNNSEATSSDQISQLSDTSDLNMEMLTQVRKLRPTYVTSIFSSLVWSPCPSRSLGFAVGPFAAIYDPEYFRLDNDDEDDSDDEIENDDVDDGSPLSIQETARKMGEGIRQLYFAPQDDRPWIHADVNDGAIFPSLSSSGIKHHRKRPELTAEYVRDRNLLERSVLASTLGVPNRALSLMRDILALPAYRTSAYTQIWIPNAQLSGSSSGGNMTGCQEVSGCNCFLGGAIIDSTLLPPPGMRLPYYNEGRYLQFIQARNAIRGWIRAALPLGSGDDVGQSYLHCLVETFIMSLYERGHGAYGEGGGKGSYYYTKRYAIGSGLNSPNLDFLPLVNIEDDDVAGVVEEKGKEHLWRSSNNGTETHTSSLDEFVIGQLQAKDFVEALERNDKAVPVPSMGWQGSHQSVTFLSHNSASSTALGCGALDFVHPGGGQMYQAMKTILLNRVFEGRAGITHLTRVIRAAFIASFLRDVGLTKLELPDDKTSNNDSQEGDLAPAKPPFVVCIEEMIKKKAISHPIFTRALRVLSGPIHEAYLRGNLVDIGRNNLDGRLARKLVTPEGFPNSYVRGASGLYLRLGAHVESADGSAPSTSTASQSASAVKGIHLHVIAEPVIPDGGTAFGGPVTLRVIENEGQCREFVKTIPEDGSRADWGPILLHNRCVSTVKKQQAASGISDTSTPTAASGSAAVDSSGAVTAVNNATTAFSDDLLHKGGFQALELIRITNITPLLWVRLDPHGLYNGRMNIMQQDACFAEQLFHDGDAIGQVEAVRALAERPLKIQGTPKITNVHDVPIAELPVRVLGDCLRGSIALHSDLPHNPAIRSQAALAIAQWQNNKAPESRHVVGGSSWLGLDLLMQYFKERYYCNGNVLPVNFRRIVLHKHIAGGTSGGDTTSDGGYQYLDALSEKDERENAIEFADEIEIEEDEEYRVRSACVTAIASIRAKDGMTPQPVVEFLEDVLVSGDKASVGSLLLPHEEDKLKRKQSRSLRDMTHRRLVGPNDDDVSNLPYVSLSLVAEALLSLCYVNVRPQSDFDPTTGRPIQIKTEHPIVPLLKSCRSWLDWDLERERLRAEVTRGNISGIGDSCHANIAPCAITALCHLTLLKQCTTTLSDNDGVEKGGDFVSGSKRKSGLDDLDESSTAQFYIDIYDNKKVANADAVRAAAAQAVACICCAADRNDMPNTEPLGLLLSLEFMLDRILESTTSPGLRLTLALLMMDACTGKICSLQRVGSFSGQGRLCGQGARFTNGPLGASCGGDNGSSLLLTVADSTLPAANAVNDGARRGLRLLKDPCKDGINQTQARVARFASRLWRTMNGETVHSSASRSNTVGICAHDCHLRCQLVALWQWIWPRHCYQVMRSQSWHTVEGTPQYYEMGMDQVIKTTAEERDAAALDDQALAELGKAVDDEIDKQRWRGEMASEAYSNCKKDDMTVVGQPLPLVKKDEAWRLGGWVASTAQQRRVQGADGGSAVTKIRLLVSKTTGNA